MEEYPFFDDQKATPTPRRGGCFSILMIPLVTILIIIAWLRFLHGGPDSDFALRITINEIPASAHAQPTAAPTEEPIPAHRIAPFFAPSVLFWEDKILEWAAEKELDPNLVATVMQIESCGDPRALSPAGAMGLFQVMPYHFEENEAPYNPDINARRGLQYLLQSLKTHGTIRLALAGYNGGINTAGKPESEWPNETYRYAYWGSGIFKDARNGQITSSRLEEWYQAGGITLCNQAELRLGITP
jgi:hypothetical protein